MRWGALALVLPGLASCSTLPADHDPMAVLAGAEAHLAGGDPVRAVYLLEALDPEAFTGANLERYKLRLATALARGGWPWDSFELLREMESDYPFTERRTEMQALEYEIGRDLIESSWTFWIFASDAEDGRVVLEHYWLRYPNAPNAADALRLLGEKAFGDGDYDLAIVRFTDLLLHHKASEWAALASFRVAMSFFFALEGPEYDIHSMERAHAELADFLDLKIENPSFVGEARAALVTVRSWLGRKHRIIADFYKTIGNERGWWVHLEKATAYPETEAGQEAEELLAARPDPSRQAPAVPGGGS